MYQAPYAITPAILSHSPGCVLTPGPDTHLHLVEALSMQDAQCFFVHSAVKLSRLAGQWLLHAHVQVCGLSAIYCCYTVSNEPVSTEIPSQWPPNAAPIPAGLENASLDCASGNCTENAPAPAAVPPAQPAGNVFVARDAEPSVKSLRKVEKVTNTYISNPPRGTRDLVLAVSLVKPMLRLEQVTRACRGRVCWLLAINSCMALHVQACCSQGAPCRLRRPRLRLAAQRRPRQALLR